MALVRAFGTLLLMCAAAAAVIALLALCARVAGGPNAWKVALVMVATLPWLIAFLTRERR